jgi:hypothetical protein
MMPEQKIREWITSLDDMLQSLSNELDRTDLHFDMRKAISEQYQGIVIQRDTLLLVVQN